MKTRARSALDPIEAGVVRWLEDHQRWADRAKGDPPFRNTALLLDELATALLLKVFNPNRRPRPPLAECAPLVWAIALLRAEGRELEQLLGRAPNPMPAHTSTTTAAPINPSPPASPSALSMICAGVTPRLRRMPICFRRWKTANIMVL